jgi:DNA polymerase IV
MFIDMNSFFASCEQQVNFYLRGRPVGVCAYTGRFGCVIAPSIEAKQKGVKTGMRLNDAIGLCPDLVPIETHPSRYREFHSKIIKVLRMYSEDVFPKSIDEAAIDLTSYTYLYKDVKALEQLGKKIKSDIREQVGDWLRCSIGIAPNAFLGKLGSSLQKPDGLVVIMPENIDAILKRLKLTDLPGIGSGMAERLARAGINTPLELRYAKPDYVQAACKSVVGHYWHQRLNFKEVEADLPSEEYKSMQAMRQISAEKRKSVDNLTNLFVSLCMTLEKRMVRSEVFCRDIGFFCKYEHSEWKDHVHTEKPVQDGTELMNVILQRMKDFEKQHNTGPVMNTDIRAMGVFVTNFVGDDKLQYHLFEDTVRKDKLRKTVYDVKDKYGYDKLLKAMEMEGSPVLKDAIGFGSIKDLQAKKSTEGDSKHYERTPYDDYDF